METLWNYAVKQRFGIAFITVLLHAALLEALRDNLTALYVVHLVVAVSLIVLYLVLLPYLIYNFHNHSLQDMIGAAALDTDENAMQTAPRKEAAAQMPQARRMSIINERTVEPLTRRELQVADCMLRGLRRAEIKQELKISPDTINTHRKAIYSKFGIHSRQELFRLVESLEKSGN